MQKQNNIPQLRFPEFNEEWERKKMEDLTEKIGDGLHGTPKYTANTGFYFINGNNLIDGKVFITENTKEISQDVFEANEKGLTKNSLLISINGTIGNIAGYNDEKVMLGKSVGYFNFKEDSSFYYQLLRTDKIQNYFISELTGTTIRNLSLKTLRETSVSFPSLQEQNKIASFHAAIDKKLQSLNQKRNLLEQYKKGIMQKIFSQELRFKDTNEKHFPEWQKKKLGEAAEINPKSEKLPQSFIYIDLESVVQGRLNKEERISIEDAPSRAQRLLKKNDILFQMVRPYQKNNYLFVSDKSDYVASTGYAQIRTSSNPFFLYQLLHEELFVNTVIEKCTGTSYPAINSTDLSNIVIEIPAMEEQIKIANFLSAIDEKINRTETQIEKIEQFKKGLLQKMFC